MADNVGLSPAQPCNGFREAPDRFENRVPSWGRSAGNWIDPWGWEVRLIILDLAWPGVDCVDENRRPFSA